MIRRCATQSNSRSEALARKPRDGWRTPYIPLYIIYTLGTVSYCANLPRLHTTCTRLFLSGAHLGNNRKLLDQ